MIAERVADVVTVEVIRNALNAAADEMGTSLARSAYTPIIYEMKDYSVAIFNQRFELLGQAPGLPIFLGALEDAVRVTVTRYGEREMRPGDVYLLNDAYLAGSHLNDVSVFTPIYFEGELIGYAASKTHWMDIGAMEPSQTMAGTEIWQEGYRLGPTRIVRGGRLNRELMQLLEDNSRLPRSIRGDFQAQMAACRTGERRLIEVYTRFGKQVVEEAVEKIFAQCERQDRDAVAALPDGTWAAEGYLDNDGHGTEPVPVRLRVRIDGSDIYMDLAGSAPQTSGCLNCGFPQTVSAAKLAFKFLINPDVPASGGTFRCLHVTAPTRSLFAAQEPAACQYYGPHLNLMIDLFIKIMSGLLTGRRMGRGPRARRFERPGRLRRRRPQELPHRGDRGSFSGPHRRLRARARLWRSGTQTRRPRRVSGLRVPRRYDPRVFVVRAQSDTAMGTVRWARGSDPFDRAQTFRQGVAARPEVQPRDHGLWQLPPSGDWRRRRIRATAGARARSSRGGPRRRLYLTGRGLGGLWLCDLAVGGKDGRHDGRSRDGCSSVQRAGRACPRANPQCRNGALP
ncbi:MAG: hydantoinase B/oxoprolinase family protein [Chloroflexi bacterium]|nr:MAG: hydantoinase B/oxoprolinase family protein [Chloroflexota bacterium]